MGKKDLVSVKALQLALSNGTEAQYNDWDGDHFVTTRIASKKAYAEAGIKNPREEISMMELHDCFSITEFVTYEDLHISPLGGALKDVMDGFFNIDGGLPAQVDGGLKCFGHPIGASGLRMLYEMYLQLHGRAGERQLKDPKIGLTHNLGGFPFMNVCSIGIVGKYGIQTGQVETYEESFHGVAIRFGMRTVANCASCHGVHDIRPPEDPASSVNVANIPQTCGQCPPGANANYARGKMHVQPKDPESGIVYYVSAFFKWLTILTVFGLVSHILLDLFRQVRRRKAAH